MRRTITVDRRASLPWPLRLRFWLLRRLAGTTPVAFNAEIEGRFVLRDGPSLYVNCRMRGLESA